MNSGICILTMLLMPTSLIIPNSRWAQFLTAARGKEETTGKASKLKVISASGSLVAVDGKFSPDLGSSFSQSSPQLGHLNIVAPNNMDES